eukprot:3027921-Rhodomonas_salina.1
MLAQYRTSRRSIHYLGTAHRVAAYTSSVPHIAWHARRKMEAYAMSVPHIAYGDRETYSGSDEYTAA